MYESIESLSSTYSVSTICSALDVNRSSYLYWLNHRKKSLELKEVLFQNIFLKDSPNFLIMKGLLLSTVLKI